MNSCKQNSGIKGWIADPLKGFLVVCLLLLFPATAGAVFEKDKGNTCINCHSQSADERLKRPFTLWSTSRHAEVGNTCDGCHGGNPKDSTVQAMYGDREFFPAPAEGQIGKFCGKCHVKISENFSKSAHSITETRTCIDCHGSHAIKRISPDIIKPEICSQCHSYEEPQKLKTILVNLHSRFHGIENKLKSVGGVPTQPLTQRMQKIWHDLRKVRIAVHTFDVKKVGKQADKVIESLDEEEKAVDHLVDLGRTRKRWGYISIAIFSLLALLTYLYNRENSETG